MNGEPAGDRDRRDYGMGRGRVFPASRARSLLNPLRRLVQPPARTVAAMGLAPDTRVLEIGSGPGWFSPGLADAVPRGFLVAVDLQPEMLRHARRRLTDATSTTRRCYALVSADAMALPFADGSFDALLVATVLGEVPDATRCLAEARRVLRPGGTASFAETRRDSDFIPFARLAQLVGEASFEPMARAGGRWQYMATFRAT